MYTIDPYRGKAIPINSNQQHQIQCQARDSSLINYIHNNNSQQPQNNNTNSVNNNYYYNLFNTNNRSNNTRCNNKNHNNKRQENRIKIVNMMNIFPQTSPSIIMGNGHVNFILATSLMKTSPIDEGAWIIGDRNVSQRCYEINKLSIGLQRKTVNMG
ncbi:unnamed protein product [Absidia cylindrospora]